MAALMTTLPKAKEVRPLAEKMITLGKRDNLHARRQLQSYLLRDAVAKKVFERSPPRFADRNGGYSRIIKLGNRKGDGADLAIIELLGSELEVKKAERAREGGRKETKGEKRRRRTRRKSRLATRHRAKGHPKEEKKGAFLQMRNGGLVVIVISRIWNKSALVTNQFSLLQLKEDCTSNSSVLGFGLCASEVYMINRV